MSRSTSDNSLSSEDARNLDVANCRDTIPKQPTRRVSLGTPCRLRAVEQVLP